MLAIMSRNAIARPADSNPRNVLTLWKPENQIGPSSRIASVVAV